MGVLLTYLQLNRYFPKLRIPNTHEHYELDSKLSIISSICEKCGIPNLIKPSKQIHLYRIAKSWGRVNEGWPLAIMSGLRNKLILNKEMFSLYSTNPKVISTLTHELVHWSQYRYFYWLFKPIFKWRWEKDANEITTMVEKEFLQLRKDD